MRTLEFLPYILATLAAVFFVNAVANERWSPRTLITYKLIAGLFFTLSIGAYWISTGDKPDETIFKRVLCPLMPSAPICKELLAINNPHRKDNARDVVAGSGTTFRDNLANGGECRFCPEMVVLPAGTFTMGAPPNELGRSFYESQSTQVAFRKSFAIGKYTITFNEWEACVTDGGCLDYWPQDYGLGRGRRPVINVAWSDARRYVQWLSRKTGRKYRLQSEAEREYAARAGTNTPFWWGATLADGVNVGAAPASIPKRVDGRTRTFEVGSFKANRWGINDAHGNVLELTDDCWSPTHKGANVDGSARTSGDCAMRVTKNSTWDEEISFNRSAYRGRIGYGARTYAMGFRVVREID